jgi:hypothetical protein
MKQKHWREMVEIVGVLSIVASVLLLAWEVKQSNHIAKSQMELQISDMYNQIQLARATDTDFAKLFAKIDNPENQLFTATDLSQVSGLTWHYINLYWVIQSSFDNGMLDQAGLDNYKSDVAHVLETHPTLANQFIEIFKKYAPFRDKEIFEPIADLIAARSARTRD